MMIKRIIVCFAVAFCSTCFASLSDLDNASPKFKYPERQNLTAVEKYDNTIVAVGEHGTIIRSHDNGKSWRQSAVPVSAHITDVEFVSSSKLWAVGHRGVILHSKDGGKTWAKQLDGVVLDRLAVNSSKEDIARIEESIESAGESKLEELEYELEEAYFALEDAQFDVESNPANQSILDVHFISEKRGFAVGSYGLALKTSNAGKTWERITGIDNPDKYILNSVDSLSENTLLIVGEYGFALISQDRGESWAQIEIGTEGSLFDILPLNDNGTALLIGANGEILKTINNGIAWQQVKIPSGKNFFKGLVYSSTLSSDYPMVLSSDGTLVSIPGTSSPNRYSLEQIDHASSAISLGNGKFLVVGKDGVNISGTTKNHEHRYPFHKTSAGVADAYNYIFNPKLMIISFDSGEEGCTSFSSLDFVQKMKTAILELQIVETAYSISDWVKTNNQGMNESNPKWHTLSSNQSLLSSLGQRAPESLLNFECNKVNLLITLKEASLKAHAIVSKLVKQYASKSKSVIARSIKIHNGIGLKAVNSLLNERNETVMQDVVTVDLQPAYGTIFSKNYLKALQKVTDDIFMLHGIEKSEMRSLYTYNVRTHFVGPEGFEDNTVAPSPRRNLLGEYQEDPKLPVFTVGTEQYIERLKENIIKSGQVGRLVSDDYRYSSIYIPLTTNKESFIPSLEAILESSSLQYTIR